MEEGLSCNYLNKFNLTVFVCIVWTCKKQNYFLYEEKLAKWIYNVWRESLTKQWFVWHSVLQKRCFLSSSQGKPSRSDLVVLVAHNDDPTGEWWWWRFSSFTSIRACQFLQSSQLPSCIVNHSDVITLLWYFHWKSHSVLCAVIKGDNSLSWSGLFTNNPNHIINHSIFKFQF